MSATIADDSDIIRTFDAQVEAVKTPITSRSLAGVSERMILIPDIMSFTADTKDLAGRIASWITQKRQVGAIVLTPSEPLSQEWSGHCTPVNGSREVEEAISKLQAGNIQIPYVFAARYDGIDLPGDLCRLVILSGLPKGTSNYELFRAASLYGSQSITKILAQRIEQGIGRGARGSGDHCIVLLIGADLAGWVAKDTNFKFLTNSTQAQLEMGVEVSKEIESPKDLVDTISKSLDRDIEWVDYHAETLAEKTDEEITFTPNLQLAVAERKAFMLWQDGYHEKAINKLDKVVENGTYDYPTIGWIKQFAARILDHWENKDKSAEYQMYAYSKNRNLIRPKVTPPYTPLYAPDEQSKIISENLCQFKFRKGFLKRFEEIVSFLNPESSSGQFEQALSEFFKMIGFKSERKDENGLGPDILCIMPGKIGLVIEAKSRKKDKNALTKDEHGQLLVAGEWFSKNYPDYSCFRVSIHPKNRATQAAVAGASHALTYHNLNLLISEAKNLLAILVDSLLEGDALTQKCQDLLENSSLQPNSIVEKFLLPFEEE